MKAHAKPNGMDGPAGRTKGSRARSGFYQAALTLLGVVASFLTVYTLCRWCDAQAAPAILAAILAMTLSRREHPISLARAVTAPVVLAVTALVATGAAWLLHAKPALGAAVYVAVIFLSIWLRNFDERAKSVGAFIALPLVALLLVPGRANAPGGPLVDLALAISAGVVSLAYVTLLQSLARRFGLLPSLAEHAPAQAGAPPKRPGISVPTRMALQMAVALTAAFACGYSLFPAHSGWTVLTAFIVCSGARGRGDAAYKGLLRLGGAIAGTLAAALLARLAAPSGPAEAVLIFVVLFFGLWLRDINYAYWAACMTLILALLSRQSGGDIALLGMRLEAILVGALCAVAAAWFVFPIRTEAVIRRRLADALGALDRFVAREPSPETVPSPELALFEHRMVELESVAVPMRWHRRIFSAACKPEHPAHWIDLAHEVKNHARSFAPQGSGRLKQAGAVRRAIGLSRRAIADHGKAEAPPDAVPVSEALRNLRDVLTPAVSHAGERERAPYSTSP